MPFIHNYGKEASSTNETASTSVPTHVKKGIPWKKILAMIVVSVALIVFVGFLYDTIYDLAHPVASITDVSVTYDNAVDGTYYAYFRLKNSDGKWTTSDGTVSIKITRDNSILYEDTFTVHRSDFKKGEFWAGIWFWYYRWTFPASDVPELPAPLTESVIDRPTNVMATITFTTPQGETFTGIDDVFPYVDY